MQFTYFLSSLVLICVSFVIFRVLVRNNYHKRGKLSCLSYTLEFVVFALHANFMYLFIPVRWPELPNLPSGLTLNIVARAFLYSGLVIVFVAIAGLGIGPTMGKDKKRLKQTGLYKYSRNPQVIGYGLILISFIICYPSLYSLGWFLLFVFMIGLMIRTEEEFLTKTYGADYRRYCQEVPRILGIRSFSKQ